MAQLMDMISKLVKQLRSVGAIVQGSQIGIPHGALNEETIAAVAANKAALLPLLAVPYIAWPRTEHDVLQAVSDWPEDWRNAWCVRVEHWQAGGVPRGRARVEACHEVLSALDSLNAKQSLAISLLVTETGTADRGASAN